MGVVHNPRYHGRPTVMLDKKFNLIKEYPSMAVCSSDQNVAKNRVRLCCLGSMACLGNYIYMLKEDYEDPIALDRRKKQLKADSIKKGNAGKTKYAVYSVFDIDNPLITNDIDVVLLRIGNTVDRINSAIRHKKLIAKKYFILTNDDINKETAMQVQENIVSNNRKLTYYLNLKAKK